MTESKLTAIKQSTLKLFEKKICFELLYLKFHNLIELILYIKSTYEKAEVYNLSRYISLL